MNSLLLNNGCLYGIYGKHLCSCYPILLFSGSFPFLSPQPMVAVLLLLAILQCGTSPRLQLIGGRKNTYFWQNTFPDCGHH